MWYAFRVIVEADALVVLVSVEAVSIDYRTLQPVDTLLSDEKPSVTKYVHRFTLALGRYSIVSTLNGPHIHVLGFSII